MEFIVIHENDNYIVLQNGSEFMVVKKIESFMQKRNDIYQQAKAKAIFKANQLDRRED